MHQFNLESITSSPDPVQVIVIMTPEESMAARIQMVVAAEGGRAFAVATPAAFVDAMDHENPILALVDIATPGDWATAIARCKLRPHTQAIPIYAFGAEIDITIHRQAMQAGVDAIWPTARVWTELAALVDRQLRPPVRYPAGWNDTLPYAAQIGLLELNAGNYFEQHEHLEEAWRAELRPIRGMYQGILQVGLAFLQIERDNWSGALKMFRRGLPRLRNLPDVCQGVHIGKFRAAAEQVHMEITKLGPKRMAEYDKRCFPKIEFVAVEHNNL